MGGAKSLGVNEKQERLWGDRATRAMLAQVLVTTDKKNYTANDALQLLKDLNLTQQVGAAHVL